MLELLADVAAQAELFGGYAMACDGAAGRIGPVREVLALAGAVAAFGATPGAARTADGRVTDAALGIAVLLALVAAVPEVAAPGLLGATAGGDVEETVAVIE